MQENAETFYKFASNIWICTKLCSIIPYILAYSAAILFNFKMNSREVSTKFTKYSKKIFTPFVQEDSMKPEFYTGEHYHYFFRFFDCVIVIDCVCSDPVQFAQEIKSPRVPRTQAISGLFDAFSVPLMD